MISKCAKSFSFWAPDPHRGSIPELRWGLLPFNKNPAGAHVRVPELLGGVKILPKSLSLCLECNNVTDN